MWKTIQLGSDKAGSKTQAVQLPWLQNIYSELYIANLIEPTVTSQIRHPLRLRQETDMIF